MKINKIHLIVTIILFIGLIYTYYKQFEVKINNDVYFEELASFDNKNVDVVLDSNNPHKAIITLNNLKESDKEIDIVLTIRNDNNKIKSTLKNLELSGDYPSSIARSASFPDGAQKTTLNPKETTTVLIKIKIKDKKNINNKIKFNVTFTLD